jgi:tRNA G18 (ribose-2'-O)-methylase SpoU
VEKKISTKKSENDVRVILHDIRSTHNVGSMFRTSDAAGVSILYLSGYTPAPVDQFGRKRKDVAKTALGAEDTVRWESVSDISNLISDLKKEGFEIIAIEQSQKSVDYKTIQLGKKSALLVGNEVGGISPSILKLCDVVAEIPMLGKKESLNVSVAFGVALFRMLCI